MARTRATNRTTTATSSGVRTNLPRRSRPARSAYLEEESSDPNEFDESESSRDSDVDASSDVITDNDEADGSTSAVGRRRSARTAAYSGRQLRASKPSPRVNDSPSHTRPSTSSRSRKALPKSNPESPARRRAKRPLASSNHRQLSTAPKRLKVSSQLDIGISNERIPDWRDPRVPYAAWVDIFWHAGGLGAETGWLLHAATICKAFSEPALTALYRCPSIKSAAKGKKLVSLLERPPQDCLFNYQAKVQFMYINIESFPLAMIDKAVRPLRRLKELIIYSPLDQPPYRELDKTIRWHYPEELFRAFDRDVSLVNDTLHQVDTQSPIMLKSWEWSSRLLGGFIQDVGDLLRVHQRESFAQLTKLSFINFQVPSLHKAEVKVDDEAKNFETYQEDGAYIEAIAEAISALKCLKSLTFESATVMNHRLLPLLPRDLVHLELVNCWEVRSEDLASFLRTHGHRLRTLTLFHNQSLNLAFLTDLAETCPQLQEIRMNLSYFRHHESVDDSDPNYESALQLTQVPLWPLSLRVIEIEHVRNWDVDTAEMFLNSLVESAPHLMNLRHLAIKTMLNIPWQRRATLRQEWREKLEKVFLRPWHSPNDVQYTQASDTNTTVMKSGDPVSPSRRSIRIASHGSDLSRGDTDMSGRLRENRKKPMYREPDTDEDEVESEDESPSNSDSDQECDERPHSGHIGFVQGLCNTVSILFDNQKVREIQYGMEDFNDDDDESSGEEWAGDRDVDDPVFVWK
ncbi:unnamed protein product [Clonostachys rosea]|uniref:F-box domain-containing protein n=1 Tax=Bionectria ochroleuca TaxID=29856 RepID=A0ABY6U376_BIOOC|nr:unnamed protein product [Clonostachys rosea]